MEEQGKNQEADLDRAMSWKQLRPSALRAICRSTVIGASTMGACDLYYHLLFFSIYLGVFTYATSVPSISTVRSEDKTLSMLHDHLFLGFTIPSDFTSSRIQ